LLGRTETDEIRADLRNKSLATAVLALNLQVFRPGNPTWRQLFFVTPNGGQEADRKGGAYCPVAKSYELVIYESPENKEQER
jgi:hypothetical protein